jgi:excisionase family DNA binding protein
MKISTAGSAVSRNPSPTAPTFCSAVSTAALPSIWSCTPASPLCAAVSEPKIRFLPWSTPDSPSFWCPPERGKLIHHLHAGHTEKAPETPKDLQRLERWAQQGSNLRLLPCEIESGVFAPVRKGSTDSQTIETIEVDDRSSVHRVTGKAPDFKFLPTRPLPELLLTLRAVARVLGVCTATVSRLCSRGELRCVRIANAVRVHPADLDAFIATRRGGGR